MNKVETKVETKGEGAVEVVQFGNETKAAVAAESKPEAGADMTGKKPDLKVAKERKPAARKTAAKKADTEKKPEEEKPVAVTFTRDRFQSDIDVAANFASRKDTMPVLSHILLDVDGQGHCTIMATDLEVAWSKVIDCKGPKVKKCLPAALLLKEVKALPVDVQEVILEFNKNEVTINGRCRLFTLNGDDFPAKPDVGKWKELHIDNLIVGFRKVSSAMGDGDTRYTLNGAFLDFDKNKVVATDGHRLHLEEIRVRGGKAKSLIVPSRAVTLMLKYPLTEVPKLRREKGKPKVGEPLDKKATFPLDVFGHKCKVQYNPTSHKGKLLNVMIGFNGPFSETGYRSEYFGADVVKRGVSEAGSLKDWIQAAAEDKYLLFQKTVAITVSDRYMTYPAAGGEMLIRAIEGNFPTYSDVIPKENKVKVRFGAAEFLQNMNGVIPLTNEGVLLRINSHLVIESNSPDRGNYRWQIPCKTEGKDKGTIDISFTAKYLIDAIKAFGGQEVLLEIKAPENANDFSPAIVNKKAIVMPRRA